MKEPKYSIGNKVKIINYGHLIWQSKDSQQLDLNLKFPIIYEDDEDKYLDMTSSIVGKEGVITKISMTQGMPQYSIEGIPEKVAWYDEQQLELIENN